MPWKLRQRTEIVHLVVTGYQKMKYPRKHYVFVIDVTWNNSDRFEIYRRYSDFFSFQTTLKALFPTAAGRRNEERVIPALPKRIFVGRSHVAKVAEARLEQINRYCQTLVSLEPKVSESAHVIGYFSPRIGDKQLPKLHLHRPASLHPLRYPAGSLFEEYCALADYEADDESQVSFKSGDKVLVMSRDLTGWWMCECKGSVGWAPPSYLKKSSTKDTDSDSEDDYLGLPDSYKDTDSRSEAMSVSESTKDSDDSGLGSQSPSEPMTRDHSNSFDVPALDVEEYKAIDLYEAEGPGQVSFEEGDIITVVDKMEDGWWFVSNGQDEGWAPCSYLEPLNGSKDEDDRIYSSLDAQQYMTVDAYTAEEDDEISFSKGTTVNVLQKSLDGWWLIKSEGRTGLAPATFLKKGEDNGPVRKSSLPSLQNEFLITKKYQQPPRKQSVRIRASLKKQQYGKNSLANAFLGAYKNGVQKESQLLTSRAADETTQRTSSEEATPGKLKLQALLHVRTSPNSSDSEDSGPSLLVPRSPRSPRSPKVVKTNVHNKVRNFEKRSTSESSLSASEDGSSSSLSGVKAPLSPRARSPKPQTKPKPNHLRLPTKTKSFNEVDELRTRVEPPLQQLLKPRYRVPEISEPPAEQPKLVTPKRPRGSEIRRAHEKAESAFKPIPQRRSPSPSPTPSPRGLSPLKALPEESGEESDASGNSRPYRLHPPRNGRLRSSTDAPPPSKHLPPAKPSRNRTISEAEAGVQPSSMASENPFNQHMADAMIKYILASNDPGLRDALKRIISSDPEAMAQLTE